ncbi:hypothetical protein SNE40_018453 [Patella caerulea]|uniref:Retrotransposon gag domain-containing protein n=1 Tax=Patella caerulea TaxID=87958 RepID=A0AAN8J521_PATCE
MSKGVTPENYKYPTRQTKAVQQSKSQSHTSTNTESAYVPTQVIMAGSLNIQLPTFSGLSSENAKSWIQDFNLFYIMHGITDNSKIVSLFSFHLKESAKRWFENLPNDVKQDFKLIQEQFKLSFSSKSHPDIGNIKKQPGESCEQYINRVDKLFHNQNVDFMFIYKLTLNGLYKQYQKDVDIQKPQNWSELKAACALVESHAELPSVAYVTKTDSNSMDKLCEKFGEMLESTQRQNMEMFQSLLRETCAKDNRENTQQRHYKQPYNAKRQRQPSYQPSYQQNYKNKPVQPFNQPYPPQHFGEYNHSRNFYEGKPFCSNCHMYNHTTRDCRK